MPPQSNPPPPALLFGDLRPMRGGSRPLPAHLARLLPDPMREAGSRRYHHQDLAAMSQRERRHEAERIRAAIRRSDLGDVPSWLLERLGRLREAER